MRIKTENKEELKSLLYLLYANGFAYHGDQPTPEGAFKRYNDYPILSIKNKTITGNKHSERGELSFRKDIGKVMEFIIPTFEPIEIKDVGDYEAIVTKDEVQVGCQTISFEKIDEIVNAVKKARA